MFTELVGQLDALEGKANSELLQVLKNILGNCSQELVHRGPVIIDSPTEFEGPVEFEQSTNVTNNAPGSGIQMFWAKATAAWTDGALPYVQCVKMTARAGSPTADVVTLYLPKTKARTPNVQIDDVLGYIPIDETTGMCSTGYLDDPIGTIKGFDDPDNIPAGWELVAKGRMIYGYDPSDPDFDEIGGTGGGKTHTHDDHTGDGSVGGLGGVESHDSVLMTGWGGGETIPFTGTIEDYTESAYLSPGDGAISYSGGGSGMVEVSSEDYDCTLQPGEGTGHVDSEEVQVQDPGHGGGSNPALPNFSTKMLRALTPPTPPLTGIVGVNPTNTFNESYADLTFNGGIIDNSVTGVHYTYFRVGWDKEELFDGVKVEGEHTHTLDIEDIADMLMMGSTPHTVTMDSHGHSADVSSATLPDHQHSIPPGSGDHSMGLSHSNESNLIPFAVYCWIKRVA